MDWISVNGLGFDFFSDRPFATNDHMVQEIPAGGQALRWDMQNKETSSTSRA